MRDDDPQRGSESGDPLDLAALRADDEFVEHFSFGRAPMPGTGDPVEDELAAMFSAWVQEVRPEIAAETAAATSAATPAATSAATSAAATAESPAVEPETEHVAAGVAPLALRRPGPKHAARPSTPYLRRFAVAATLVVMAGSGVALGAWDAEPGEVLWPVTKVFYAEKARSVEAVVEIKKLQETAREALARGDRPAAAAALAAAEQQLDDVRPDDGRADLSLKQFALTGAVTGESTTSTPSGSAAPWPVRSHWPVARAASRAGRRRPLVPPRPHRRPRPRPLLWSPRRSPPHRPTDRRRPPSPSPSLQPNRSRPSSRRRIPDRNRRRSPPPLSRPPRRRLRATALSRRPPSRRPPSRRPPKRRPPSRRPPSRHPPSRRPPNRRPPNRRPPNAPAEPAPAEPPPAEPAPALAPTDDQAAGDPADTGTADEPSDDTGDSPDDSTGADDPEETGDSTPPIPGDDDDQGDDQRRRPERRHHPGRAPARPDRHGHRRAHRHGHHAARLSPAPRRTALSRRDRAVVVSAGPGAYPATSTGCSTTGRRRAAAPRPRRSRGSPQHAGGGGGVSESGWISDWPRTACHAVTANIRRTRRRPPPPAARGFAPTAAR